MTIEILLASKSPFRAALMKNAGLAFKAIEAKIDERAVEATFNGSGATPEDIALVLGEAKALDVSSRYPDALVIGCDQTLSLEDEVFHKPADMDAARRQLLKLSGKTHELNSAVVIARGGAPIWRHVAVARMTMRALDPGFIGRYLAHAGEAALSSVGAYQIEGLGLQLFEKIDGDYFTIVGLPMLPLLAELRKTGAIDG
ncbi:Maf-like protein [Phyllobacterium leguminum]|uniref:7-methyl-GTP pyrophosphatase n=1 Tax=Phyllobacterium leguminum TaxID=314237 RepID=A0A318TJ14_9HYPH|nr:Maf-like protein [Phyllobacterium leguminum]PYE89064.1 septum formation protein [Phyllobacterium leguminum]